MPTVYMKHKTTKEVERIEEQKRSKFLKSDEGVDWEPATKEEYENRPTVYHPTTKQ